jgi:hypothetical protein
MTAVERVKRHRERRRKGERSERELSDTEKLALARREVRELRRQLRLMKEEAIGRARSEYYVTAPLQSKILELQRLLAMHGIALPWEQDRMSVRSLRVQCSSHQWEAAGYAAEARRHLSRHRRFPDAGHLTLAVLAQRKAAQEYALARSTFATLVEAVRLGVP